MNSPFYNFVISYCFLTLKSNLFCLLIDFFLFFISAGFDSNFEMSNSNTSSQIFTCKNFKIKNKAFKNCYMALT